MSGVPSPSNCLGEQHQPGECSRFQVVRTLDGGGGKAGGQQGVGTGALAGTVDPGHFSQPGC